MARINDDMKRDTVRTDVGGYGRYSSRVLLDFMTANFKFVLHQFELKTTSVLNNYLK